MVCPMLAMCATFLCAAVSFAQPPLQKITILLRFEHPESAVSRQIMQTEIQSLLGRSVSFRFGTEIGALDLTLGRLVAFRIRGYCSMNRPVDDRRTGLALGSTFVSDGSVLPFGEVECDRIRASIQRVSHVNLPEGQRQLGQAMGRVILHELYHMLSGSSIHTKEGLTKRGLSSFELIANTARLPRNSADAMEITGTLPCTRREPATCTLGELSAEHKP
jgi:hypothetical protein